MNPATLPAYTGPKTPCPKCGNDEASTDYRETGTCIHNPRDEWIGMEPNERLHRACQRCGYAWDEAITRSSS